MEQVAPKKLHLSWDDATNRAVEIANQIPVDHIQRRTTKLYGVPRGGIYAAMLVGNALTEPFELVEDWEEADFIIDDIIDTGKTKNSYIDTPFLALVDKQGKDSDLQGEWVVFPWERMNNEQGPEENIRRILEYIGEDPSREGLQETPSRVVRSYATLFGGYKQDPKDVMKVFGDGACDEMVLLKGISFYSNCEHHMLPFSGVAHIAYIPNGRVIGVSKLARILEIYSRRLQIQERIGQQITTCLMDLLQPKGAACILQASHLCMTCRGVQKQGAVMITSSLKGDFLLDARTRSEFMSMIQ